MTPPMHTPTLQCRTPTRPLKAGSFEGPKTIETLRESVFPERAKGQDCAAGDPSLFLAGDILRIRETKKQGLLKPLGWGKAFGAGQAWDDISATRI